MSWIKDINELDFTKKAFVISIPILMPYWFVSFYFFWHDLFYQESIYLQFCLSFCLSLNWFLFNIALSWYRTKILLKDKDKEADFIIGGVMSIIILSCIMCANLFFHLSYLYFILMCFGYIVLMAIKSTIAVWLIPKKLQEVFLKDSKD